MTPGVGSMHPTEMQSENSLLFSEDPDVRSFGRLPACTTMLRDANDATWRRWCCAWLGWATAGVNVGAELGGGGGVDFEFTVMQ